MDTSQSWPCMIWYTEMIKVRDYHTQTLYLLATLIMKLLIMSDGTYKKNVDWDLFDITTDEFTQLQEKLLVERDETVEVVNWNLYLRWHHFTLEPYQWITIWSLNTQIRFDTARSRNYWDYKFYNIVYQWYENWVNEYEIQNIRKYEKLIDWDIFIPHKQ